MTAIQGKPKGSRHAELVTALGAVVWLQELWSNFLALNEHARFPMRNLGLTFD